MATFTKQEVIDSLTAAKANITITHSGGMERVIQATLVPGEIAATPARQMQLDNWSSKPDRIGIFMPDKGRWRPVRVSLISAIVAV